MGYGYGEPEGGGGSGSVSPASETVAGIAEVATQAETDAGTDDARIVTSLKLATRVASLFSRAHDRLHKLYSSADHSDVDASVALQNGQVLIWDATAAKWKPGTVSGGASGPPKGHLIGAAQRWDSGTAYSVEPGEALVNGTLLSWGAAISRTALALAASSIFYVYLFDNAGTPALLESTTAPVWDPALGYFKLGGATPDASRRCLGFVRTDANGALYRFHVAALGRVREWYLVFPNATGIEPTSVIAGGTSTTAWASLSLAAFVPAHATHFFAAAKLSFAAAGDDAIIGVSPVDLGTSAGFAGPYTVRDSAPKATTKTFFGRSWLPIGANVSVFYRLQIIAGSPAAEVESHGAKFVA